MKKRKFLIIFAVTVSILWIMLIVKLISSPDFDFFIFSDISECDLLYCVSDDAVIDKYDTPTGDKHLGDLKYKEFFGAKYTEKDIEFEIFAYSFESAESAQKYFEHVTGKDYGLATNYYATGSFMSYILVAIDNENAYFIDISNGSLEELEIIIEKIFSIRLTGGNRESE